jgi:hypothetical protein
MPQEGESLNTMYERSGLALTDDSGVTLLAGSTLGGGTRVNWCVLERRDCEMICVRFLRFWCNSAEGGELFPL